MDDGPPSPVSRGTSRQEGTEAYRLLHFPRPSYRLPPFLTKFSLDSTPGRKGKLFPLEPPFFLFQGNNLLGGPRLAKRGREEKKLSKIEQGKSLDTSTDNETLLHGWKEQIKKEGCLF